MIPELQNMDTDTLMNDRMECLILKHTDYRENSILVSALTKAYGKLSFTVAGAKKSSSKNANQILPYTKSEFLFDYKEDQTIFRLKSARCQNYYRYMHENLEAIACATLLSEACDALCGQDTELELQVDIYTLLEQAYDLLNRQKDSVIICAIFFTHLLQLVGVGMDVDECVSCGKLQVSAFSVREGGFLCANCANRLHVPLVSTDVLYAMRFMNKADFSNYDIVAKHVKRENVPVKTIIEFFTTHTGIKLRSFAFFERFLPLNRLL